MARTLMAGTVLWAYASRELAWYSESMLALLMPTS